MTETIAAARDGVRRKEIQTRMFDTTRWDHVRLREDDIIVSTWAKSGTTLTQQMVFQLITGGADEVAAFTASPWVDVRFLMPLHVMAGMLEAQGHRRVLKTHLPFAATPFSPSVKYLYIGRDGRDVLWSAYNHATSFTEAAWAAVNASEGPWPKWGPIEMDVRDYYLNWLRTDTMPNFHDLSFWDHVQSWWDERHRPNVLLLHYANLIADLPGEMRRLVEFLQIEVDEARLPSLVQRCDIDYMRSRAGGDRMETMFKEGAASFFNKGVNGRWKDVLSPEEIALCDEVAARRLTPDCAEWLRTGRMGD
jgi:aryl sulfotransferase